MITSIVLLLAVPSFVSAVGWHHGEYKWLELTASFENYRFIDPNGIPIYEKGKIVKCTVNIVNTGQRTFNNFEARLIIRNIDTGELAEGNSVTDWQSAWMEKLDSTQLVILYDSSSADTAIYSVYVDIRHVNESGNEQSAALSLDPKFRLIIY